MALMVLGTDGTRSGRGTLEVWLSTNYGFNNNDVPIFRSRLILRNHGDIVPSQVTGTELSD